jgi:Mn2+/Fe2+ NRAMP family transporter
MGSKILPLPFILVAMVYWIPHTRWLVAALACGLILVSWKKSGPSKIERGVLLLCAVGLVFTLCLAIFTRPPEHVGGP